MKSLSTQTLRQKLTGYLDRRVGRVEQGCSALAQQVGDLAQQVYALPSLQAVKDMIRDSVFKPNLDVPTLPMDAPFMAYSSCHTGDFFHPRYAQLCKLINTRPEWHRKQWEYVFILHHLERAGVLAVGKRGIGFGVGREPLPSAFAMLGAHVLGTDAPDEIRQSGGWTVSKEHAASLDQMRFPWIDEQQFYERVSYSPADMNDIDVALGGFDFTWSSCCLEHLGTLRKGMDFIINSVERCLKIGGIAVHTTELNLSSHYQTIEESKETVLYREGDLAGLVDELRARGHAAQPIVVGPAAHALDFHVDVPPFSQSPHLRLQLAGFVTTSVGVVVTRGR